MSRTTGKQRMTTYRQRLTDQGFKQFSMYLSPAAASKLDKLREQFLQYTVGEMISALLTQEPLEPLPADSVMSTLVKPGVENQ